MTNEDQKQNSLNAISPDGRYILGVLSYSYISPMATCTYVYDRQTSTHKFIGFNEPSTPGGKWVGKVDGIHAVEGDLQLHVVPVQNVGDGSAGGHGVAGIHIDLGDNAVGVGLHLAVLGVIALGTEETVVVELGGLHRELGLLHAGAGLLDGVLHEQLHRAGDDVALARLGGDEPLHQKSPLLKKIRSLLAGGHKDKDADGSPARTDDLSPREKM